MRYSRLSLPKGSTTQEQPSPMPIPHTPLNRARKLHGDFYHDLLSDANPLNRFPHSYRTVPGPGQFEIDRALGIPRANLLFDLARHQGSVQTDSFGCGLGHHSAILYNGGV